MNFSRISKETREKALKLTMAVYRVTGEIPKSEGLRFKIREKAGEVLGDIIEYGYFAEEKKALAIFAKIEAIKNWFEIARSSGLVKPVNCIILLKEYEVLGEFFSKEIMGRKDRSLELGSPSTSSGTNIKKEIASAVSARPKLPRNDDIAVEVPLPSGRETSNGYRGLASSEEANPLTTNGELNDRQKAILGHLKQVGEAKISDFFNTFQGVSSKTIQRDLQDLVMKNILKKNGDRRWTSYRIV